MVEGIERLLRAADRIEARGYVEMAADVRRAAGALPDRLALAVASACALATGWDMTAGCVQIHLCRCGYECWDWHYHPAVDQ